GWELFIEKENLENIFKDLFIENNNLIIDTLKIDKDSVFKLKNYREETITGYVKNQQIIFDLANIRNNDRLFELTVIKNGLNTYNYKFKKRTKYFNFIKADNLYEYVLRTYSNHSISINKKGIHSKIQSINNRDGMLLIEYISPYQE
ncbi:hypothetical protein ACF91D_31985, partial [Staphylococcus sp. 231237_7MaSpsaltlick]|uniref:hypothetical protein n=1 Tax=Staphylococcus sp. 231237_7MaSpsaltlick TaxID=3367518 RepID=UPI00370B8F62